MNNKLEEINSYNEQYGWVSAVYNYQTPRTKYTKNEIRVYEETDICEIDFYDAYGYKKSTGIFSKMDLNLVMQYKWYEDNVGYMCTTLPDGTKMRFHKFIFPDAEVVDHYDTNKLNNTRGNLQPTTHAINIAKIKNKSYNPNGVTGIYHTVNDTWMASIEVNNIKYSKTFKTMEEAVLMRYIWELNMLGKNAPQLQDIMNKYPRLFEAAMNGIKINTNVNHVIKILNKLDQSPFCPCRIQKIPENKCMCKEFREQSIGECHCGLYVKVEE